MKKSARRIVLARETLRNLEEGIIKALGREATNPCETSIMALTCCATGWDSDTVKLNFGGGKEGE